MPRNSYAEVATVTLKCSTGEQMVASALLHRDPRYLHTNRIELLGTRADMVKAMRLSGHGSIEWELHSRSDWNLNDDPDSKLGKAGKGILRWVGMASGASIADATIQPIGEIEIFEMTETLHRSGLGPLHAEFWFLQLPGDWHVYSKAWSARHDPRQKGPWRKVAPVGVKFRFVSIAQERHDDRTSQEIERIYLPAVEIRPIDPSAVPTEFDNAAERMWFNFRILFAFCHRQMATPLVEFFRNPESQRTTSYSIALEPRNLAPGREEPTRFGFGEGFYARALRGLVALQPHREILHGAAYGYAHSFSAGGLEAGLTNCVEGIERLLAAFESSRELSAELIGQTHWRKIAKQVKPVIAHADISEADRRLVRRALSVPLRLTLLERIQRMASLLGLDHIPRNRVPLDGAEKMIGVRNAIVHGRMIDDANIIYAELVRSRTIFEMLFMGMLGCNKQD